MTDQPGREPEQRLPARREPSEVSPADRFSAPPHLHQNELSADRAAQIVRQSASARWVSLLAVVIVILFVVLYYFYEIGAPLGLSTARQSQQAGVQQVTTVEAGYNLYIANCARCHGPNGKGVNEGYIAPPLNDPMKLYVHLSPQYIQNVLTVGGRYVCGNPNSIMPIWADTGGGPLNYRQIQELIAFLRAPSNETFVVRDPSLNEPVLGADGKPLTFTGWVDPSFVPAPGATPVPDCWSGTPGGGGTPAPAASLPAGAPNFTINAQNISYDTQALTVPAGTAFSINFNNKDTPGIPHNVDIRSQDGTTLQSTQTIDGGTSTTYAYTALPAGTYTFICAIHPIPAMTGTLTVK